MEKEEIKDYVHMTVQSRNQSLDAVVREIQILVKGLTKNFEEYKESTHEFRTAQDNIHKETRETIDRLSEKTEPVIEWFQNINFLKSVMMWSLGLIAAFGAALAVIKGFIVPK